LKCLMVRPKDSMQDYDFVKNHLAEGWGSVVDVSEVDLDKVFASMCDVIQLSAAVSRHVDQLRHRLVEKVL